MNSPHLDNLVRIGKLKVEPTTQVEIDGFIRSGTARLEDSANETLSYESRFDLAYNAAHSLALAALRWHGYRSENRYVVFQALASTLELGPDIWRTLAECHRRRNDSEYEGFLEEDFQMLSDLISSARTVLGAVTHLEPVQVPGDRSRG
jgi:hypothetical protein